MLPAGGGTCSYGHAHFKHEKIWIFLILAKIGVIGIKIGFFDDVELIPGLDFACRQKDFVIEPRPIRPWDNF